MWIHPDLQIDGRRSETGDAAEGSVFVSEVAITGKRKRSPALRLHEHHLLRVLVGPRSEEPELLSDISGLLETLRIPLLNGRDFSEHDSAGAPKVAIVNQTLAITF